MDDFIAVVNNGNKRYTLPCSADMSVLELLRSNGIGVYSPCGGNGTCGKCRAVISGAVSAADEHEIKMLGDEYAKGVRLACRTIILGDVTVDIDSIDGMHVESSLKNVSYGRSPLSDGRFGIAVDIGTTTVAVYLCDLSCGTVCDTRAFVNPQEAFGADVISRIDKIMRDKTALTAERNAIISALNGAIAEMIKENNIDKNDVRACVIGGNTVMEHIACGVDPSPIAVSPFRTPTLFDNARFDAGKLGIDIADDGVCLISPCFASYVGGDIALGIVASDTDISPDTTLFLDIGTNGEIVLSVGGRLYLCSAAAGPAFEGAGIECGCAGVDGAVCAVMYSDGVLTVTTVGNAAPCGICGSGLIDATAVMLEMGVIDETGAFNDEMPDDVLKYVRDGRFYLTDNVYVSAVDVRQIQLAKAAVCAGILTLMHRCGIEEKDIARVVLAGGFGSHINARSASAIGLIPGSLYKKAVFAGNTAGVGAVMSLCDDDARHRLALLCDRSEYTELSTDKYFAQEYINQMAFE